jgi:hypothetical protein
MGSPLLSPFARRMPGVRIKKTSVVIHRPTKEEINNFLQKSEEIIKNIQTEQSEIIEKERFSLKWIQGKHFLIAGATGSGLGASLANALLNYPVKLGSLTLISRDPRQSESYYTGVVMQRQAQLAGTPFYWTNRGIALEGESFNNIVSALKELKADNLIYINTVAAASSGLLSGTSPIYVKDIDEEGLFQWELGLLSELSIKATKFIMGEMAIQFPEKMEDEGIKVQAAVFADWRGSLDYISRNPLSDMYARQGPYSTSLYLPKDIVRAAVSKAYKKGQKYMDFFFPTMKTRALSLIPGGNLLYLLYDTLMKKEGIRRKNTPELALLMLQHMGNMLEGGHLNPFPRLDSHETSLDLWLYEVVKNLTDDAQSDFYYKKWTYNHEDGK